MSVYNGGSKGNNLHMEKHYKDSKTLLLEAGAPPKTSQILLSMVYLTFGKILNIRVESL